MRALFDLNHPAHVHLFRYVIDALETDGHDVVVTSREKDVTTDLLDAYGIEHRLLSQRESGLASLLKEWAVRELRMLRVVRETDPDVIVGRLNPWAVHAGAVTGTPTVAVMDTKIRSPLLGRAYNAVTYPFVDTLCAPPDFDVSDNVEHYHLDYQELAYLHRTASTPSPTCWPTTASTPNSRTSWSDCPGSTHTTTPATAASRRLSVGSWWPNSTHTARCTSPVRRNCHRI
jgi:predicted glycosyltransferase